MLINFIPSFLYTAWNNKLEGGEAWEQGYYAYMYVITSVCLCVNVRWLGFHAAAAVCGWVGV